jgi:hypothetical protein
MPSVTTTARRLAAAAVLLPLAAVAAQAQDDKPNILVIWGDDIGISNISAYTFGLVGYQTPNIDRIAGRRDHVHRLLRRAVLHRRPVDLHHRADGVSHRPQQGRHAGRPAGHAGTRTSPSPRF